MVQEEKVECQRGKRKDITPIESRSVRQCFQSPTDGDILPHLTESDLSRFTYSSACGQ